MPEETVVVATIEKSVRDLFQDAAFQRYEQSVITYGQKVWREARSVAHQRDPDATRIEVTTPDVEAATVRVEMRLARLRQLRFPFRHLQQVIILFGGILVKWVIDLAYLPQDSPSRSAMPAVLCSMGVLLIAYTVLLHFEHKEELLR